jgi:hypothetical protein
MRSRLQPASIQAFSLVGPITTANTLSIDLLSGFIFELHNLTADGLAKVTISADWAATNCSVVHFDGTVEYVFKRVT